jgi:hypothetical protein
LLRDEGTRHGGFIPGLYIQCLYDLLVPVVVLVGIFGLFSVMTCIRVPFPNWLSLSGRETFLVFLDFSHTPKNSPRHPLFSPKFRGKGNMNYLGCLLRIGRVGECWRLKVKVEIRFIPDFLSLHSTPA